MSTAPPFEDQPLRVLIVEDDADDVLLCRDAIAHGNLHCELSVAGSLHDAIAHLDEDGRRRGAGRPVPARRATA